MLLSFSSSLSPTSPYFVISHLFAIVGTLMFDGGPDLSNLKLYTQSCDEAGEDIISALLLAILVILMMVLMMILPISSHVACCVPQL